jgi:hypothetical protein
MHGGAMRTSRRHLAGHSLGIEALRRGRVGRAYIRRSPHIASKLVDLRVLAAPPVRNIERPLRLRAKGVARLRKSA